VFVSPGTAVVMSDNLDIRLDEPVSTGGVDEPVSTGGVDEPVSTGGVD
jgi:hypothetical protein